MSNEKRLLVDISILPSSYLDVIKTREMIEEKGVSIARACQENHISRSTYYKYRDLVFLPPETGSKKANLSLLVDDEPGVLSDILETISQAKGNVLTIHQSMPMQGRASLSITLDIKDMKEDLMALLEKLKKRSCVRKAEVIAYEE